MVKEDRTIFWGHLESIVKQNDGGMQVCRIVLIDISEKKFQEDMVELATRLIAQINTPDELHQRMLGLTASLQKWSGCEAVGIRLGDGADYPYYETRGFQATFIQAENRLCVYQPNGEILRDNTGNPVLECMCGNVLSGRFDPAKPFFTANGSFWSNNTTALLASTTEADRQARTRNRCNGEGYESVALIPLRIDSHILGLLQFNDRRPDRFSPALIGHFEKIASIVAVALWRHQAEESLQKSEALYRGIGESIDFGVWVCEPDGRNTYASDSFLNMVGITQEQCSDFDWGNVLHPDDAERTIAMWQECARTGGKWDIEHRFRGIDGKWHWVLARGVPIWNKQGEIISWAGINLDIAKRKQDEEHLRDREEKFRTIANYIHDWEYWRAPDGSLVYVSPSCERITDYRAEEFSQDPGLLTSIIHPDDRWNFQHHVHSLAKSTAKGDYQTVEFRILTRIGEERLIEHICKEVFNREGKSSGRRVSNRDITERKRAEMELLESERLYHSLFENMMNGFAYCRMLFEEGIPQDFIYLAVNDAFEWQTGLKDVVGRKVTEVIPGIRDRDPELFAIYGRVAVTHEPTRFEMFVDALQMWFSISVYSPRHEHFVAVFDVITERKKAEESLRESETRLKLVLDGSQLGFWDWNIETGKVIRNARWAEMLGYTLEEVEFSVKQWTDLHHPDDRDLAWKSINDHLEGRTSAHRIEYRMLSKDGHYRWILDQAKIVSWDSEGKPLRMCGTHTDITERKVAEQEKEKLQTQLTQAQKMESVGRLAGGVAHDFNNMLSVIIGYAELALDQVDPSSQLHQEIREIYNAAKRSADITQQLLAFARKQTITPRVLDLNDTFEGMLKMLRRLIGEDIELVWLPGSGLGQIKMDPSQLDQLLANLCVNSRDAIKGVGKVTVQTSMVTFDEVYCENHEGFTPGDFVLLAIKDDGCGMDKEILSKIFEPFFTTKEVGKGTGLGLATVYGIVNQNNGFVNVYSEPGHGTTFNIYLPVHQSDVGEIRAKTITDIPLGGKETILIVEDEASVLKLGRTMLERLGYTVLTASTPFDAIRSAEANASKINLVITDVIMPEMNGRDLSDQLHALYPEIKSLFMSGYTADVIAHRGILDEGVHFIHKPFSIKDLAVKVREALNPRIP
jgi:PAS domain S-box-containing protein